MREAVAASEIVARNKLAIVNALKEIGAISALMEYKGEGDSGYTESIVVEFPVPADDSSAQPNASSTECTIAEKTVRKDATLVELEFGTKVSMFQLIGYRRPGSEPEEPEAEEMGLHDALDLFCDQLICLHGHRGYENNEGGGGEVTILVETGMYVHDHHDYIVETIDDSHSG